MTPSHVSNAAAMLYRLQHAGSAIRTPGTSTVAGAGASTPTSFSRTYGVQSAALLALSQIGATNAPSAPPQGAAAGSGATAAGATGSTTAGQPASNTVQAFLQSLYAALQAQAALDDTTPANAAGGTSGASANPAAAIHGHHGHHAHHGGAGLSSLIQQLSASTNASAAASSTASASSTAAASSAAISGLEQSFNNLVAATGESSNGQATLANFLSAFARDLSSRPAGTLLSASA